MEFRGMRVARGRNVEIHYLDTPERGEDTLALPPGWTTRRGEKR